MKITLETVRHILKETFGRNSFVASFIRSVEEDEECPTAGITPRGDMKYSPQFVKEYVKSPEDLFCLVAHELMHPMFGHFIHGTGTLENIAADMVINATLSQLFAQASGGGSLFKNVYTPQGIEGLLRPGSQMRHSRYYELYERFYTSYYGGRKLTTGEVIHTLKILSSVVNIRISVLLGSHGTEGRDGDGRFSSEVAAKIADDLKQSVECISSRNAGFSLTLQQLFLEALRSHLSIRKALLQKFTTTRKVDRFRQLLHRPSSKVSPIPIHPSKWELVMLSAGVYPVHFRSPALKIVTQMLGLAVYLDVSGSVNQYLPKIIGILSGLKQDLQTIFLFSNKVVEVPFRTLLQGRIETTMGTDFDCVAKSILERQFDKAVIFTDGYAFLKDKHSEELKAQRLHTLTILFHGKKDCREWEPFGDVVQLQDITT